MRIENHRLVVEEANGEAHFEESPNQSGPFEAGFPDTLVIHYTAGASFDSAVRWLMNPKSKASAHLVVGKQGEVAQLVPFDRIAWHAGRSRWKKRSGLNRYSLGIEIDNAGLLEKRAGGYYTWFDTRIPEERVVLARHKHEDETRPWEAFTQPQIQRVDELCRLLAENYPIRELLGHDDIAPGRKRDPGPAFPLAKLQSWAMEDRGQTEKPEDKDEDEAQSATSPGAGASAPMGVVTAEYLNIRSGPGSAHPKVSEALPRGSKLRILEVRGGWLRVALELEGWVSAQWVER
jgi:N-acetylmuramoyl-L-alanine amidase